jgi:hypothetical protein
VKYTILILFSLFIGWGEHKDAYGWLCSREDMCGVRQNSIFYEIVRETNFCFSKQRAQHYYRLLSLLSSPAYHTLLFLSSHYNVVLVFKSVLKDVEQSFLLYIISSFELKSQNAINLFTRKTCGF